MPVVSGYMSELTDGKPYCVQRAQKSALKGGQCPPHPHPICDMAPLLLCFILAIKTDHGWIAATFTFGGSQSGESEYSHAMIRFVSVVL